jgi:hypothetical protein
MGAYSYKAALSRSPLVDQYELNGKYAYVLVKPSENGSTLRYTLSLKGVKQAFIYHPVAGKDQMNGTKVKVVNGRLPLLVSETPMFIMPLN